MNYITSNIGLTVFVQGKQFFVDNTHSNIKKIFEIVQTGTEEDFLKAYQSSYVATLNDSFFREENGEYYAKIDKDWWKLPQRLSEEIQNRAKYDLDLRPIELFVRNLFENPSYDARERTFNFLANSNLPITEDGHFLAYKCVRQDRLDMHSRKIYYGDGCLIQEDRKLCDDNPNNPCSKGLHVGDTSYLNYGPVPLVVKVNPRDVVTVPIAESHKMRVCELKVIGVASGILDENFYDEGGNAVVAKSWYYIDKKHLHKDIGKIRITENCGYMCEFDVVAVTENHVHGYNLDEDEDKNIIMSIHLDDIDKVEIEREV